MARIAKADDVPRTAVLERLIAEEGERLGMTEEEGVGETPGDGNRVVETGEPAPEDVRELSYEPIEEEVVERPVKACPIHSPKWCAPECRHRK